MQRRAVVTGGCSGLGAATVTMLRDRADEVIVLDLAAGADLQVDIGDEEAVRQAVADLGPVDILVNSAGVVGPNRPLWQVTDEEWLATFRVNVLGTFHLCRELVPGMRDRGWGRVVNLASIAGKDGNPNMSAYSASKAAVIALTKSLGKELATSGVLVNAVVPAVFATPMNATTAPDVLDHITSLIPMKRVGQPDEVAQLIGFLTSEACSFSTGATFDITGGRATY